MELTLEQQYMLSVLNSQCHGIDPKAGVFRLQYQKS